MANIRHILFPESAQFKTSAFPQFVRNQGTYFPVTGLAYDASTDEAAFWKFVANDYASGNLTLDLFWYADTASAGNVVWEAQVAVITPNTDSQNIETDALTTLNYIQDTHLGTTGQRLHQATLTISNLDSLASGDLVFIRIARDANGTNATDDLVGDAILVAAVLSYTAA